MIAILLTQYVINARGLLVDKKLYDYELYDMSDYMRIYVVFLTSTFERLISDAPLVRNIRNNFFIM